MVPGESLPVFIQEVLLLGNATHASLRNLNISGSPGGYPVSLCQNRLTKLVNQSRFAHSRLLDNRKHFSIECALFVIHQVKLNAGRACGGNVVGT